MSPAPSHSGERLEHCSHPLCMAHSLSAQAPTPWQRALTALTSSPPPYHSPAGHPAGPLPVKTYYVFIGLLCCRRLPHETHSRNFVGPVHHLEQCPALSRCLTTFVTDRMKPIGTLPVVIQAHGRHWPSRSPATPALKFIQQQLRWWLDVQ